MNDELEALKIARQSMMKPGEENIRLNDAVTFANQLPAPPHPREELEKRIPMQDQTNMDLQGIMLPNKAADIRTDDSGTYPVDAQGNRLNMLRRPAVLPFTVDEGDVRWTVPYALELAGNVMGGIFAPVKGAGTVLGSGPIRRATEVAARELNDQGMYSAAREVLGGLKQEKMAGQDMVNYMKGKVPADELKATGFEEWAASRPNVTRQEAMDYLRAQQPEVREVVLRQPTDKKQIDDQYRSMWQREMVETGEDTRSWDDLDPQERAFFVDQAGGQDEFTGQIAGNTKYGTYTLPGGENYREVLLTLPESKPDINSIEFKEWYQSRLKNSDEFYRQNPPPQEEAFSEFLRDKKGKNDSYRSSHWDEPNVLAHLRMSDRNIDGRKVLHIEEIQSDWAQEGRKKGFRGDQEGKIKPLEARRKEIRDELNPIINSPEVLTDIQRQRMNQLQQELASVENEISSLQRHEGVPQAPYVTDTSKWTQLALKRALREAAAGGYDEMIITPGIEQAKRYDLSKQVSAIHYNPETKYLMAKDLNGNKVLQKRAEPEELGNIVGDQIAKRLIEPKKPEKPEDIDWAQSVVDRVRPDQIGRDPKTYGQGTIDSWFAGRKISKEEYDRLSAFQARAFHQEGNTVSGVDLRIGGEGMIAYYDKIVPAQLRKLIKEIDPKADVGYVKDKNNEFEQLGVELLEGRIRLGEFSKVYTEQTAREFIKKLADSGDEAGKRAFKEIQDFDNGVPGALRPKTALDEYKLINEYLDYIASKRSFDGFLKVEFSPEFRQKILTQGFKTFADGGAVKDEPTEAQKAAGNYKKKHIKFAGFDIAVENEKGAVRRGKDKEGDEWSVRMPADYGYIKRTEGNDGDHLDVYVGPDESASHVWVINQRHIPEGKFDEHKCMLGFKSEKDALKTYERGFSDGAGKQRIKSVVEMTIDQFKNWVKNGDLSKPAVAQKPEKSDIVARALKIGH